MKGAFALSKFKLVKSRDISTKAIAHIAMIAAIYAALTIALAPISYGPVQLRVAEALTVLPYYYPMAAPGLFLGCFLANIFGGYGWQDVVFGSLATLTAALLSRRMPHPWLVPLPPVIVNAVIIGTLLHVVTGLPLTLLMLDVGLGQLASCYGLGLPLLYAIKKYKSKTNNTDHN